MYRQNLRCTTSIVLHPWIVRARNASTLDRRKPIIYINMINSFYATRMSSQLLVDSAKYTMMFAVTHASSVHQCDRGANPSPVKHGNLVPRKTDKSESCCP